MEEHQLEVKAITDAKKETIVAKEGLKLATAATAIHAAKGKKLDSFGHRTRANPKLIGKEVGPLGWVVTEDAVLYSYSAINGGGHDYYHDSKTGRTYQDSAYW